MLFGIVRKHHALHLPYRHILQTCFLGLTDEDYDKFGEAVKHWAELSSERTCECSVAVEWTPCFEWNFYILIVCERSHL